jgi:NodT family efflux transporter outer membrane factor (OMF) lipoprotein
MVAPLRKRLARTSALALALGVGAAGCAVGPNYVAPDPRMPDAWHQDLVRGLEQGEANLQTWWTLLDDPVLTRLIDQAARNNLDLQGAAARVAEARARRGVARGAWFPSLGAAFSYARAQFSEELLPPGAPLGGDPTNVFSTGVDSSWEIDIFGRIRRSVESANANLEASTEDYRDVLVTVLAEVALTYVDARTQQERIRHTEHNIETQRGSLDLTRARFKAGLVGELDVQQALENLSSTESFLPVLEAAFSRSIHALGVLLGEHPNALYADLSPPGPIPLPPEEILVGVPTDVLRQRPDIRAAERSLSASTARIGAATADLYPRLSLLGTFAFDALDAAKLFTGDASAFSVGPSIRWNLFDGGRVRANIDAEDAITEQALVVYEQTILDALLEVEDAMVDYTRESERSEALERSAAAAEAAVGLVKTLYRTGLTNFQNVLDTERSQFVRQDELANSRGRVTQNLIRIYKALGGGWSP